MFLNRSLTTLRIVIVWLAPRIKTSIYIFISGIACFSPGVSLLLTYEWKILFSLTDSASIAEIYADSDLYQPGCSYWGTDNATPIVEKQVDDQSPHDLQSINLAPQIVSTQVEPCEVTPTIEKILPVEHVTTASTKQASEQSNTLTTQEQSLELDPDLLNILGEDPTASKEYGKEVQKDLAVRLNHIATSGLPKETRKELKEKYLIPANCKFIKAPTLNPEIRASLQESQAKRDKGIEYKQMLTSCALSSLAEAITLLLSSEQRNPDLLKLLMDTARTLSDIQHTDSMSRRYFILSTVNKQLKDQLEKTKIDEMLFGNSLAETVKSAKTIISTGAQLRSATNVRSTVNARGRASTRGLNYRAPPATANRRALPSGGVRSSRAAPPATRHTTRLTTHHSASRTSSRQQQPRHRR